MLQSFIDYCRRIPNNFMYAIGIDKAEQAAKGFRYNLIRQLFHFAGGVAISLIGFLLPLYGNFLLSIIAYGAICYGEVQDIRKGQSALKSILDLLIWCIGFSLPLYLRVVY